MAGSKRQAKKPSIIVPPGSRLLITLDGPCVMYGRFVADFDAETGTSGMVTLDPGSPGHFPGGTVPVRKREARAR